MAFAGSGGFAADGSSSAMKRQVCHYRVGVFHLCNDSLQQELMGLMVRLFKAGI